MPSSTSSPSAWTKFSSRLREAVVGLPFPFGSLACVLSARVSAILRSAADVNPDHVLFLILICLSSSIRVGLGKHVCVHADASMHLEKRDHPRALARSSSGKVDSSSSARGGVVARMGD
jgi:hypothetical protein